AHGAVAYAADLQVFPGIEVDAFEQFRGVGTEDLDLAERADVDESHARTHRAHFRDRVAVTFRPLPLAGIHPDGASRLVPVVHRRAPHRVVPLAGGEHGHLHRHGGRTAGCRPDGVHLASRGVGTNRAGREAAHFSLARAHVHG